MVDGRNNTPKNLITGTLYAISVDEGWYYYGQVMSDQRIGFFRRRDRAVVSIEEILSSEIMSRVSVFYDSIGRAIKQEIWQKLGCYDLSEHLVKPWEQVHWSVGTLNVTVWSDKGSRETRIDDPAIQELEISAVWNAIDHIPKRLEADFNDGPDSWRAGGTVFRERLIKEDSAVRFPNIAHHQLPSDWVFTTACQ